MENAKHTGRRILKWTGGILGGIIILLVLLVIFFPTGYVFHKAAGVISDKLGREVAIDGPARIDWHFYVPEVHAEKIRIANIKDSEHPNMVEIGELDFTFRLWKLLIGRTEIPDLRIIEPRIYLEKRDAKTNNWDFPALSSANAVKHAALPSERGDFPLIGNLRVKDGKLAYKDTPRNLDVTLDMDTAHGRQPGSEEDFSFKGDGTLEGQKFTLKAEGGSLELLRDTHKPFPLDLSLDIGSTNFSINGTFEDPVQLKGLDAKLHLNGNNLADLYYLIHVALPSTASYKLDGQLVKEGDEWKFSSFAGAVGNSDLSGDVTYNTVDERPLLAGKLFSKRLDVKDLGGFVGAAPDKTKQVKASGDVLPDVPLDLKRLRAGDLDVTLTAEKLVAPGLPLEDMKTHIDLRQGLLDMKPLSFGLAGGTVDGSLRLDGREDVSKVATNIDLKNLSLKQFFTSKTFEALSKGRFGGHIELAGSGNTLAKVLGDSDGRIVVIMSGGQISLLIMEASDLDIAQITPLILGKDQTTDIRCAVGDFDVTKGLLQSRVFILDTTETNLKGDIKVNLKDETIDSKLNARPKNPSPLSLQSKILVLGKLKSPTITLDPVSTGARAGSAVLLGLLNPIAAVLPFLEPGTGKDSNCGKLIAEAKDPDPAPPPDDLKKEKTQAVTKKTTLKTPAVQSATPEARQQDKKAHD